jgi:hypothetical protein
MVEVTMQSEKYAKKKKNTNTFHYQQTKKIFHIYSVQSNDTVSEVYMTTTVTLLKKKI